MLSGLLDWLIERGDYVIAILLVVFAYIFGTKKRILRLPPVVEEWLTNPDIVEAARKYIVTAEMLEGKTNEEKREFVKESLKNYVMEYLKRELPDSIAYLIIEYVFSRLRW